MYHLRRLRLAQRRFRRRTVKQQNTAGYLPHTSSSRWPSKPWAQSTPLLATSSARSDGASRPSVEMGAQTSFLYQRLSITIQRYNLVAFSCTFSSAVDDEA